MIERSRLTPEDYVNPDVLKMEQEQLFYKHWHLIGLKRDFPDTDDWNLVKIAQTEVIIQNFGNGDIRAFTNTCPHRFSALKQDAKGNGALRCPYHLWLFDKDGLPAAVPLRGEVSLEACRAGLHLERWSLSFCGDWIFIARKPEQSLQIFLGPFVETLDVLSRGLGREIDNWNQDIKANWKLLLQNTLELDHAYSVHPETFAPMMAKPIELTELEAKEPHLSYLLGMKPPFADKPALRRIEKIFTQSVLPPQKGHVHWLIFPSGTVGMTFNRQIALITYQPLAPDLTLSQVRLFMPVFKGLSAADQAILEKVIPFDAKFTRQLFAEDGHTCELQQRGLTSASRDMHGALLPGEKIVRKFQGYWLKAMGR